MDSRIGKASPRAAVLGAAAVVVFIAAAYFIAVSSSRADRADVRMGEGSGVGSVSRPQSSGPSSVAGDASEGADEEGRHRTEVPATEESVPPATLPPPDPGEVAAEEAALLEFLVACVEYDDDGRKVPVPGALVRARHSPAARPGGRHLGPVVTAETDGNGVAKLSVGTFGTYHLHASKDGYASTETSVRFHAEEATAEVVLSRGRLVVHVEAVTPAGGPIPVGTAIARAVGSPRFDGGFGEQLTADLVDGYARFHLPAPGSWMFGVHVTDQQVALSDAIMIAPPGETTVRLVLPDTGSVRVVADGRDGRYDGRGRRVEMSMRFPRQGPTGDAHVLGDDGTAQFDAAEGEYDLLLEGRERRRHRVATFSVQAGRETTVEVRAVEATLSLLLLTPDRQPILDSHVSINASAKQIGWDGWFNPVFVREDLDGRYRADVLLTGEGGFTIRADAVRTVDDVNREFSAQEWFSDEEVLAGEIELVLEEAGGSIVATVRSEEGVLLDDVGIRRLINVGGSSVIGWVSEFRGEGVNVIRNIPTGFVVGYWWPLSDWRSAFLAIYESPPLEVRSGEETEHDVVMRAAGVLEGEVTLGGGAAGAHLDLLLAPEDPTVSLLFHEVAQVLRTDAAGRFMVPWLPPGHYRVDAITRDGRVVGSGEAEIVAGAVTRLTIASP